MASIAVGIESKIPIELMVKSISNIKAIPGRMEFIGDDRCIMVCCWLLNFQFPISFQ